MDITAAKKHFTKISIEMQSDLEREIDRGSRNIQKLNVKCELIMKCNNALSVHMNANTCRNAFIKNRYSITVRDIARGRARAKEIYLII